MEFAAQFWEMFLSDECCVFRTVATVVGLLYLLKLTISVVSFLCPFIKSYILAPCGLFRLDLKKYGSWAVVTGASEGIGKGYAIQLAKRGMNVVIMSRSQEKLEKVANEIKEKYPVEVMILAVDFLSGQEVYPQIAEKIQDLDIGVLVNNVGLGYEFPMYFLEVPSERLRNIIELNCQSMVQMTHVVLPKMVERKKGVIINLSSSSAFFPAALMTVYSATKVFVVYFSEGLRQEYCSKGIVVQCVLPGFVATAMTGIKQTSLMVASPMSFANSALNSVGHFKLTAGCIPHVMQELLLKILPQSLVCYLAKNSMMTIRQKRRARKKKE